MRVNQEELVIEYIELAIDELLLDEDNPRLGAISSQSAALEALIKLNQDHFRNLMLSIKENGLDPGDNLYVIDSSDPEDFIVLDGNRRLAALRVLLRPDILEAVDVSETIKKSLLRASDGFDRNKVEPIRCVLFDDRPTAEEWIFRRHTGDMDGEGRINWGRTEIQRFTGDRSVLDVIDFVGRNADYTEEEWAQTKSVIESRKSSNIGRLLESSAGKAHIGISIRKEGSEKIPVLTSDPTWALGVLKRIIEDVRDGVVNSRSHNTGSEIENYFNSLPKELQPSDKIRVEEKPFKSISFTDLPSGKSLKEEEKKKKRSAPRIRSTLAPKKATFQHPPSEKGKHLLREATIIDLKKLPVSSAAVLRAFIELALEDGLEKFGLEKVGKQKNGKEYDLSLSQKAEKVIGYLTTEKILSSSDLREFRKGVQENSAPASIQSLHGFVHNKHSIPTPEAVRAGWDCSIPIFEAVYGRN